MFFMNVWRTDKIKENWKIKELDESNQTARAELDRQAILLKIYQAEAQTKTQKKGSIKTKSFELAFNYSRTNQSYRKSFSIQKKIYVPRFV